MAGESLKRYLDDNRVRYVTMMHSPAFTAMEIAAAAHVPGADLCWGQPDIIALAEAADAKAMQELVIDRVQKVAGVTQTDSRNSGETRQT